MKLSVDGCIRRSVYAAFAAGIASVAAPAFAQEAVAAPAEAPAAVAGSTEKAVTLEKVRVTGSRIAKAVGDGAGAVVTLSRADIDASGAQSVAEVVRTVTGNSQGSFTSVSGSSGQGAATVSLRGLGEDRTLVLINGHRVATSPALQGSGVDLNTIPLAAVERIEILSEGASAIYGSDAIGGVVNVILRKTFNGAELSGTKTFPEANGGKSESLSFVGGSSNEKSSLLFGANYSFKDIIFLRDRAYSRGDRGDGTNLSTTTGINAAGNTVFNEDFSDVFAAPAGACEGTGLIRLVDDAGSETGIPGAPLCGFDFTSFAADTTAIRSNSLFTNYRRELTNDWALNATVNYARSESFGRFAPAPALLTLDAANPNNPYGETVNVFHRYVALGPRDNVSSSDVFSALAAVEGKIGIVDVELGLNYNKYSFTNFGDNYVLNSVARNQAAAGNYNPFNPSNAGSQATLDSMKVTINRRGLTDYREVFANGSFAAFQLPAGALNVAFGGEYREERFFDMYDSQSEAGTVGGSAGNSSDGDRNTYAVFGEAVVPVLSNLPGVKSFDIELAARYDRYSDVGGEVSPKVALKYKPIDEVLLRASYSEGFRAPLLSELNANDSTDAPSARDFVACRSAGVADADCPEAQYDNTLNQANPDLQPETAKQYALGLVYSPLSTVDVSLDYYNIEINGSIETPSLQTQILREANGQPFTPGSQTFRNQAGALVRTRPAILRTFNYAAITTEGIDLNFDGRVSLGSFGRLRSTTQLGYVLGFREDDGVLPAQNQVGRAGVPRYRFSSGLDWSRKAFAAAYNFSYIPGTASGETTRPGDPLRTDPTGKVESYSLHDVQGSWTAPFKTTFTVGVNNLLDEGPSVNKLVGNPNYDQTLYDPTGRVVYVRLTQKF